MQNVIFVDKNSTKYLFIFFIFHLSRPPLFHLSLILSDFIVAWNFLFEYKYLWRIDSGIN